MPVFLDEYHLLWCAGVSTGMHLCVHVCVFVHIHAYYMYVKVCSHMEVRGQPEVLCLLRDILVSFGDRISQGSGD